jgi:AcrR family transcriptional regulator
VASSTDPTSRSRTRRRGRLLEEAIYSAALHELAAAGYGGLTMEGIAHRAGTGKAALYRRWPSKKDLLLDAMSHALPDPRTGTESGSVRDNLLNALKTMSGEFARQTPFPSLDILAEMTRDPELRDAFATRVVKPRLQIIVDILRRGVERKLINPRADLALIARTGPALVLQAFLLTGKPPPTADLNRIVDTILVPLLAPTTADGELH